MLIKIITVGKLKNQYLAALSGEYMKRLAPFAKLEIVAIRDAGREKEAEKILALIDKKQNYVIALGEEGKEWSSRAFADKMAAVQRKIMFIVGGPDGLSPAVKAAADEVLSLSRMTFTHEMAQYLLLEQLYRSVTINNGGKYHND